MRTRIFISFISIVFMLNLSCKKEQLEKLFKQPSVSVTGYTLIELPGDTTYLDIDMIVTNNDDRDANIADIDYNLTIEGVNALPQKADINQKILVSEPLELTLPLRLLTKDAIKLLSKMNKGESLDYSVLGTFHVDDPIIRRLDLPIDISGSAGVEGGFDDFYKQPEVTINDISGTFTSDGKNYTFDFDVNCTATNLDNRQILINEIEYVVTLQGVESKTQLYSMSYSNNLEIGAQGTVNLNLPVSIELDKENGALLADAVNAGNISYLVEGVFHVKKLDETEVDFSLPLYLEGNTNADFLTDMFQQPSVEITGYLLKELPGDSAYIDINMLITNNDSREAVISDIEYQVTVEGIISGLEHAAVNKTILVGTPLELTLPLAFLTSDAIMLLDKLDAGERLNYEALGLFHVNEPVLNLFDLPLDISGSALVEVGYEDFYKQPEVTVNKIDGTYSISGFPVPTNYTFNLDVDCSVENIDSRKVTINEVEYIVTVEGVESSKHYYSHTYSKDLIIAGNEIKQLTMPVTLNLNAVQGASLASALLDGTADYIIEGIFNAIKIDETPSDFSLPLYDTGNAPVSVIAL